MFSSFRNLPSLIPSLGISFLFFLSIASFTATSHADSWPKTNDNEKTLQIWDQDVQYHYLVKKNPNVDFDGETTFEIVNGQKIFLVVINPAYFEREARSLFRKFLRDKEESVRGGFAVNNEELFQLEKHLLEIGQQEQYLSKLAFDPRSELKQVQQGLEKLAWQGLFEESRNGAKSVKEAEKIFIQKFTQERISTIERHEAAHVLDLKNAEGNTDNESFARFTELNAFYTELAFGSNPLDVMSQAISGLLEELDQGKPVDFSVGKVATVIRFLKNCPRFASRFSAKEMPKCCLEMLGDLTRQEFLFAAKELYRKNYQGLKPIVVTLR